MSKGINGDRIDIIKRLDDKRIIVYLKCGAAIIFSAEMTDYEDCSLLAQRVDNCRRKR